jgi:hypothetical protein
MSADAPIISTEAKSTSKPFIRRRNILVLVGIVIIGLAVSGFYLKYHHNNTAKSNYTTTTYRYSTLDSYKLQATEQNTGMSFNKPKEFVKQVTGTGQVVLVRSDIMQRTDQFNKGYIAAAYTPMTSATTTLDSTSLQSISKVLADPSSTYYKATTSSVTQFIKDRIDKNKSKLTIGNAKPFTNSQIQSNAWQFDITASELNNKNKISGKAIYAIGSKAYYYFMLTSESSDWQANQDVWQKVLDSIQVNQT